MAIDGSASGFTSETQVYGFFKKENLKDEDELDYQSSVLYGAIQNMKVAGLINVGFGLLLILAGLAWFKLAAFVGVLCFATGCVLLKRYESKSQMIIRACDRYRTEVLVKGD